MSVLYDTHNKGQYSIFIYLNTDNIVINITNLQTGLRHQDRFGQSAFQVPHSLPVIYKLINKCFGHDPNYNAEISRIDFQPEENDYLWLKFNCLVDGLIEVKMNLKLPEIAQVDERPQRGHQDGGLIVRVEKLEKTLAEQQHTIHLLIKRIEALENPSILDDFRTITRKIGEMDSAVVKNLEKFLT